MVVAVQIAGNKEVLPMKRVSIIVIAFVALLALAAPVVMADQDEPPPANPGGGCSGPGCK